MTDDSRRSDPHTGDALATVRVRATAAEAHLDRIALEQAGIPAFVEDENVPLGDGPGWPADGAKVRVRADDAERALRVLDGSG